MKLKGTVWRALNPRWSFAPDSGDGAARFGGRFNRLGLPALYTSLSFETAWMEAQQGLPFKAQPMTICGYEVDCDNIADLTDPLTCLNLGVDPAELSCEWEYLVSLGTTPPTWLLADRLIAAGFAGIQVQSHAPGASRGDINVVFWTWSVDPPHQVRVIDASHRLPKNDLSWN